jgi:hypothetical protein
VDALAGPLDAESNAATASKFIKRSVATQNILEVLNKFNPASRSGRDIKKIILRNAEECSKFSLPAAVEYAPAGQDVHLAAPADPVLSYSLGKSNRPGGFPGCDGRAELT